MTKISNRVYMNSHDIPVQKEGESDSDFEARMEFFRKNDLRIAIPGRGKINFGFDNNYTLNQGVINCGDDKPRIRIEDGVETGDIYYNPNAGGSFSIV